MRTTNVAAGVLAALSGIWVLGPAAWGSVIVYDTGTNSNGVYTPFATGTNLDHKFGDAGWLSGSGQALPAVIDSLTLALAAYAEGGPVEPGTLDLRVTINNGDPSGLQFGDGAELYATTVEGVFLPGFDPAFGNTVALTVTIPLPNVRLAGGFNNVGWSVGVSNFDYGGQFGFLTYPRDVPVGFDVYGATEFVPGQGWHTFGFAGGIANFGAVVTSPDTVPGDYNGDGRVDAADYTVWADHFGETGSGLPGDGNNDGVVDAADYTVWADHFGVGGPGGVAAVPEPAAIGLFGVIGASLVARRRR